MRAVKLAGALVLGYLAVVLVYALMQRSFIYYPQKQDLDAALAGVERMGGSAWLDADSNWLGWHQGAPGASRRVLVMHGNAFRHRSQRFSRSRPSLHGSWLWGALRCAKANEKRLLLIEVSQIGEDQIRGGCHERLRAALPGAALLPDQA